ncbi:MAG: UvrD-helicase domain-containing protein, partial [Opitutales bacterium]
ESFPSSPVLRERVFQAFRDWDGGKAKVLKKPSTLECFELEERFALPLSRVIRSIMRREMSRRMTRTRGAYAVLSANEWVYDEWVRRRGGLTFADFPLLLGAGSNPLDRMQVEYRLDGNYRHWMLDEFQDTSPAQWRVLKNLVDEAIQDESNTRAFFCVGDVKQAIYGWRGGDSRLFDVLKKEYADRLSTHELNKSWRSGPDVLGAVNDVFGPTELFGSAAERWNKAWKEHKPSKLTRNLAGQVAWWTSDDEDVRNLGVVALLREIDPVRRGLRCAILTQKKATGRKLADFIRREFPDLAVENEVGAKPGEDNPLSVALLSLLRAAAHPGDSFSRGHLRMTPLGELLAPDGKEEQWNDALSDTLRRIHLEGFETVVHDWGGRALEKVEPEAKEFSEGRLRHLRELARSFDETGSREVDVFVEYVRGHESIRGTSESSVRVMTIHRAKGLTFDLVILPELGGGSLTGLRRNPRAPLNLHVQGNENGEGIDWVLDWPSTFFAQADPKLSRVMAAARKEACFESLCKLYVAMTRPRQGLYLFSPPFSENSKSVNFLCLLADTLDRGETDCREETAKLFA